MSFQDVAVIKHRTQSKLRFSHKQKGVWLRENMGKNRRTDEYRRGCEEENVSGIPMNHNPSNKSDMFRGREESGRSKFFRKQLSVIPYNTNEQSVSKTIAKTKNDTDIRKVVKPRFLSAFKLNEYGFFKFFIFFLLTRQFSYFKGWHFLHNSIPWH